DIETRKAYAKLTAMPNQRGGQIAANSRTDMRGRRRSAVLSWFDNESGRYLGQLATARDGRDWATVAPADAATLRARVSEMMATVTAAVGA
ncbi:MAG TPA: ESX secretion-associated protein EspG, partial [Actinophytocola sp.]|uniref:ESX secretion-associated protein EspG n=1 Tax=Actinophytocola sp. TaxID=1872138 RepID=UPI002DDCD44A